MILRLPVLFLAMLLSFVGISQQFSFIHHSIEDGLAQSQVRAIYQDYRGFIWFATMGGVSRFDGTRFINFSTEHGLLDNQVNCIYQDINNDLWFGCAGGISRFNGTTFEKYAFEPTTETYMVLDIIEKEPGLLLLATNGAGLFDFDVLNGTFKKEDALQKDGFIRRIIRDQENNLLVGTRSGLYQANISDLTQLKTILSDASVSDISTTLNGEIWVSTFGDGIFQISENGKKQFNEDSGLLSNSVREIAIDINGVVWAAFKGGVNKISGGKLDLALSANNGLKYDNIKTIHIDNEQNLWLGTDGKGVYRFSGEDFVFFSKRDNLNSDIIIAIEPESNNKLWFGSYDNGACLFDGQNCESYSVNDGLLNNTIWALKRDKQGDIWFGTNIGISKFDGKSFTNFLDAGNGKPFDRVTAVHEDKKGKLWFGIVEGLACYENGAFVDHEILQQFPGTRVRCIFESGSGDMWFGAENGLIKKSNGSFKFYEVPNGLKNSVVYNIEEDQFKNLWVGTKRGLFLLKNESLVSVPFSEGFGSNTINFLKANKEHFLYVGTNNGLYIIDTKAFKESNQISLKHFTDQEGLISLECNQNASYLDADGRFWFGTSEGVVRYENIRDPFAETNFQPVVHINNVKLLLESKNWEDYSDSVDVKTGLPVNLELAYVNNHLTFEFSGLYYTNPTKVVYQYMLEGADQDWLPETSTNYATYASLPHGKYTFRVRSMIKGGTWSQNQASFSFEILPPFYLTWWFITLSIAITVLIIVSIVLAILNNEKQKRQNQKLEYTSRMLALEQQTLNSSMNRHFIFNALNSIQYYINRQDKTSANRYLSSFAKLIRKNLDSSQSNFTTLSDEVERMELYLSLENMRFPDKFEYEINVASNIDMHSVKIPAMLFQPYLENSIWHGILPMSKPGKLTVEISRNENDIVIKITDNGIGIEAARQSRESSSHQYLPQGMMITSNRINLFRKMTNQNFKIEGPREYRSNGSVGGTEVEITFPLKTELENSSVLF
jgi:ligand-binding sensor domain-containing protein/two-component sensor histidine kinase